MDSDQVDQLFFYCPRSLQSWLSLICHLWLWMALPLLLATLQVQNLPAAGSVGHALLLAVLEVVVKLLALLLPFAALAELVLSALD